MFRREGYESRKNYLDEDEVKSPVFFNGKSAAKPQTEERSTTILLREVGL